MGLSMHFCCRKRKHWAAFGMNQPLIYGTLYTDQFRFSCVFKAWSTPIQVVVDAFSGAFWFFSLVFWHVFDGFCFFRRCLLPCGRNQQYVILKKNCLLLYVKKTSINTFSKKKKKCSRNASKIHKKIYILRILMYICIKSSEEWYTSEHCTHQMRIL